MRSRGTDASRRKRRTLRLAITAGFIAAIGVACSGAPEPAMDGNPGVGAPPLAAPPVIGVAPPDFATLVPRTPSDVYKRRLTAERAQHTYVNRVAIKFREGSGIQPRGGRLEVDPAAAASFVGTPASVTVAEAESIAARARRHAFMPVHKTPRAVLAAMKREGEALSGMELPDLSLWVYLYVDVDSAQQTADTINDLNALDGVELAEPTLVEVSAAVTPGARKPLATPARAPWPAEAELAGDPRAVEEEPFKVIVPEDVPPPMLAPAPAIPDFEHLQKHFGPAPVGMDVDYLWAGYYGAKGDFGYFSDVEQGWNRNHIDLPQLARPEALLGSTSFNSIDHGTAAVGIVSAQPDQSGTKGTAPNAQVRISNTANGFDAFTAAAGQFRPGAVILIERQVIAAVDCNNDGIWQDLVPVEFQNPQFDAIKTATANGRIVVEAAANGYCNLDDPNFYGVFDLSAARDSGAIIVGAGERDTRFRASFSNYGQRVDTHAEGDGQVVTTGYGDLYPGDPSLNPNATYTGGFSGTSSASALIAGAVVPLSSILSLYHGSFYNPRELRDVLRREGTLQLYGPAGNIGKRPNLRTQIQHMKARHVQIQSTDFDGDGRRDLAMFYPETGVWNIRNSATGVVTGYIWGGQAEDIPVPADVIDDARPELIYWRPSNGTWYIRRWDGSSFTVNWGWPGDIPVPGNYAGVAGGKAQLAVVRKPAMSGAALARWFLLSPDRTTSTMVEWGDNRDAFLTADIDNNGRDDLISFRSSDGQWLIHHMGPGTPRTITFGQNGDIPLTYRSGGRTHLATWRPSDFRFRRFNVVTNSPVSGSILLGGYGDIPRAADIGGTAGNDEFIVWSPRTETWHVSGMASFSFGTRGAIPLGR